MDLMLRTGPFALAASILLAQPAAHQDIRLIDAGRPLTASEIGTVLSLSQKAVSGKTFRLTAMGASQSPTEVVMGSGGQPRTIRSTGSIIGGVVGGKGAAETRWQRDYIRITQYTGQPARRCGAPSERGELVMEYERDASSTAWMTTARLRDERDFGGLGLAPMFEMLQGRGIVSSEERREIDGHPARAFVSPWTPPRPGQSTAPALLIGDPIPNVAGEPTPGEAIQTLWIETESLLPLRWVTSKRGVLLHGYDFTYTPIEIRPPSDVELPSCVR
jgi:hypothetical protein